MLQTSNHTRQAHTYIHTYLHIMISSVPPTPSVMDARLIALMQSVLALVMLLM